MGILDWGKKVKKKTVKTAAKVRHAARKTTLGHYAPAYGAEKTFAGTKLKPKQVKQLKAKKIKERKKSKRIARKIWRKLI